jgi:RNA polymerase sigma-70 factor (sigma-E family)
VAAPALIASGASPAPANWPGMTPRPAPAPRAQEWQARTWPRPAGRLPGLASALGLAPAQVRALLAARQPAVTQTAPPPDGELTAALAAPATLTSVVTTITAEADSAVTALYADHYRSLVRLAALLVPDAATADEVVQDSFAAMHGAWRQLRDHDKALSYLRQSVVNRSRPALRHQVMADRGAPVPGIPGTGQRVITPPERPAVVSALRALPAPQREALVLRYYADLSEAQTAATMGISSRAVKSHTAHAMTALRTVLDQTGE